MIHASEAREIMDNASRGLYEDFVEEINQGVVERSKEGYSYMQCRLAPDLFEQYKDELMTLFNESGYYVSKASQIQNFTYFIISWKEESPFYEDPPELSRWWKFWK